MQQLMDDSLLKLLTRIKEETNRKYGFGQDILMMR